MSGTNKIQNISQEEMNKILSQQGASTIKAVPVGETKAEEKTSDSGLKPKTSKFEPDPIKFDLISGKKIIKDGYLYIRKLNTEEETVLTKIKKDEDLDYAINTIFETAIKSTINITSIPIVDKLPIFVAMLGLTYGSKFSIKDYMEEDCPTCTDVNIVDIDVLRDIKNAPVPDDFPYPFVISVNDYIVTFKYPAIKDQVTDEESQVDFIKRLIISIKNADAENLPQQEWMEFIKWFSTDDKRAFSKKIEEITKYATSFKVNVDTCTEPTCCKRGVNQELTPAQIVQKAIEVISEKLKD